MGMRTYTILLAWRLLWPRRSCQRLVAGICVLGIALGLMLQIVVRGVMDGMVREIDAGTRFCMPDLLVTNWPYETGQALRVPGVRSATACQAGMGTGPHGLCRYSTWYEPEQLAPLLADGGLGQALISRSYAEKSGLRAGDYLLMQLPGHQHRLEVSGIFRVPGRMLAPDILLPSPIQGGTPALALQLTPGADEKPLYSPVTGNSSRGSDSPGAIRHSRMAGHHPASQTDHGVHPLPLHRTGGICLRGAALGALSAAAAGALHHGRLRHAALAAGCRHPLHGHVRCNRRHCTRSASGLGYPALA